MTSPRRSSASGYIDDVFYSSGYGEVVDALLEYVPDLTWPKAGETLNRMRHDSQMSAGLRGFTLPIRRASWALDPAGCHDEVAELVANDLGLPILGTDPKPTGARRRGVVWGEHLRLALGDLWAGHMPFAQQYDTSTGQARLVSLQERMPRTIAKINLDAQGQIESVEQNRTGNTAAAPTIARNALVWYVNDREGVNWRGTSMLRAAYPYWLIKDQMLRVHATSIRRFGMGMPYLEAPSGATPQQIDQAAKLSANWQASERSGGAGPAGFTPKLIGLTGSVPDALGFIKYLDQAISVSLGTQLFNLGSTETGSRAVGDVFLTMLTEQQQTLADAHALQATSQIVVPLVDANWGEDEPAPQIVCTDVGADRTVTAESINLLLDSGALSADPALEAFLRQRFRLPQRDPDAPTDTEATPDAAARRRTRARAARAATSARAAAAGDLPRQLTPVEVAAGTDFEQHQQQWQTDLDAALADYATAAAVWHDALAEQVRAAVEAGDRTLLADLTVDTTTAAAALEARMTAAAEAAATAQSAEAATQGIPDVPTGTVDTAVIAAVAETTTALSGASVASSAARAGLIAWTPVATPETVAQAVITHLDDLTEAGPRVLIGGALSTAQNQGRLACLTAASNAGLDPAGFVASELLDGETCGRCFAINGTKFDTLDQVAALYGTSGYIDCEGGARCRGLALALWDVADLELAA